MGSSTYPSDSPAKHGDAIKTSQRHLAHTPSSFAQHRSETKSYSFPSEIPATKHRGNDQVCRSEDRTELTRWLEARIFALCTWQQALDLTIHWGTSMSRVSWFGSRLHRYTARPCFTTFLLIQTDRPHPGCHG